MTYMATRESVFRQKFFDISQTGTYRCAAVNAVHDLPNVDHVVRLATGRRDLRVKGLGSCWGAAARLVATAAGSPSAAAHLDLKLMASPSRGREVAVLSVRHDFENKFLNSELASFGSQYPRKCRHSFQHIPECELH